MKHIRQNRYRQLTRSSQTRTASILTVALVITLLTFTPTNPVTADETTPNTTNTNTETSSNTDSDSGSDTGSPIDPNQPSAEPSLPDTNPSLPAIEPKDDETQSDSGQSGSELGLSVDTSGQPTPTPVGTESTESPVPFGSVVGGTWNGVTWEIRDDNNPGVDYELYLGNPDGTTPETITPTILLTAAPWYANATYRVNVTEVNIRGPVKAPNNLQNAFQNFTKLEAWNDLSPTPGVAFFDTSSVTKMFQMFRSCSSLVGIDGLADWDITNVDMNNIFYECYSLTNVDALADWDVSSAADITAMFTRCSSLVDIDALADWDVSGVTSLNAMFYECSSLTNVDALMGWNTSNVIGTHYMFYGCTSLVGVDISGWNLSKVTNGTYTPPNYLTPGMQSMFLDCSSLRVVTLGPNSRLWPLRAAVANAPGANAVSFITDGLQTDMDKFSGQWQEIGTGTVADPTGDIVGTGVQLMTRSQNAATAPGTYVWRPKYEVKLDGNGGNWAAVNPDTGLPATDAFLYVPRPATVGGAGQTVNLTNPNPITSLPTNTSSNFYGWTTTPDLLSTKTTTVGPVDSDTTVYALWSKLEIISSPTDFDFGSNPFSTSTRSLNLDSGSPLYTAVDVANGFVLSVGSNALVKWQVSATLDPFVDSVSLGGALPVGVGLDITGMTHKEQTSPPATQLPVFNPNLSLPADGTTSQIIAGSGALPADGGGVWEISIPFNNVKLTVPPVSNAYVGRWKSTLTWSLEDLP